jgi:hypothetical protein
MLGVTSANLFYNNLLKTRDEAKTHSKKVLANIGYSIENVFREVNNCYHSILVSEDIQYFLAASKSSDLEYAKTIRDLQKYMISIVNANPTMRSAQETQLKNTPNYEIINI